MANEKVDVTQGAFQSSNLSPRREADFCELVWGNGHIMMQGQSSKTRRSPFSACDFQSLHNSQDSRDVNSLKASKLGSMDSLFGEMGLGQDVDMGPWLSYPVEDHMDDDYTCGFLPELSGITINDISTDNSRRVDGAAKGMSSSVKHDIPRSGVSDITSGGLNASSLCAFTSLRLQKLDAGQPCTSSSFTNFPYFSRPAIIAKGNHGTVNTSKRSENDSTLVDLVSDCSRKEIGSHNQAAFNEISGSLLNRPTKEDAFDATKGKMEMNGEKNKEPILTASSVSSGNSVDRISNERGCDLKRKSRETTESEGPSDEVEEESVGAKKSAHARASSKRSRAAEVHNLSERKRRDRINEKMRALQELIPNCNKVDKASMLDEAIEYLKTLQLQVQMLSMGTGMYMQPMMFSPGMQPSYGQQMPHFSTMGISMGMGIGMGFGMNMVPYQNPHYPVPGAPSPFQGMPGHSLPSFAHQSMQQAPSHPNSGTPPLNTPVGLNISCVVGSSGASAKDSSQQARPSNVPNNLMNPVTN